MYVIGEGRLVNLAAGDGHPAEIMDMSFAIQALSAAYLVKNKDKLTDKIVYVPDEIDKEVANRKLRFWELITVNIVSCKLAFNRQLFKSSHIYLAIKETCVTEYSTIFHVHESFLSNNVLTACKKQY